MSLPVRDIVIQDRQLAALEENVWSKQFVDAFMRTHRGMDPIKIRYRGGHTREYPKKSYEIVRPGRTVHLNAEYDDPSMIRNALSFRFFEWLGVPSPKTSHCLITLNDESIGVYLEIEAVTRRFFQRRDIPVSAIIYAVNDSADFGLKDPETSRRKAALFDGYELVAGDGAERNRLSRFITHMHVWSSRKLYAHLRTNVDINNYLRWLTAAVLTGNYDGFDQNYALFRNARHGKYGMSPWDYEGTWGRNCYGKHVESDLVRISGYNALTKKLLSYKQVKLQYKQIMNEALRKTFTLNRLAPEIRTMHERIYPYIYVDSARKWPFSMFEGEPEFMNRYIEERRSIVEKALAQL